MSEFASRGPWAGVGTEVEPTPEEGATLQPAERAELAALAPQARPARGERQSVLRLNSLDPARSSARGCAPDRRIEVEAIDRLRQGVEQMHSKGDITSANTFESIPADEEHHIDHLDTQLDLIGTLGEALCIAQQVEQPGG